MVEQEPNQGKSQQELEAEIERLKNELKNRDEEVKRWYKFHFWAGKNIGGIFLGWQLKDSVHRLFEELKQGKVTQQTLADVATHTLWRFTRIGLFAILAAVIPVTFLALQTYLLSIQNKRIIQQIYLQEAERRSSQVFLFSNIQDKIDEELKDPNNKKHTLSDQTIGRIIALSLALKPYRYLDGDMLIQNPISPERGQLLISLTNIGLDTTTLLKIARNGDFSTAELIKVKLNYMNLKKINLSEGNLKVANLKCANLTQADLRSAILSGADLSRAVLITANLKDANLDYAILREADFRGANLREANLRNANLRKADLSGAVLSSSNLSGAVLDSAILNYVDLRQADLSDANLRGTYLRDADLRQADLIGADLIGADLRDTDLRDTDFRGVNLIDTNLEKAIIGINKEEFKHITTHPYIKEYYKISKEKQSDGLYWYLLRKK